MTKALPALALVGLAILLPTATACVWIGAAVGIGAMYPVLNHFARGHRIHAENARYRMHHGLPPPEAHHQTHSHKIKHVTYYSSETNTGGAARSHARDLVLAGRAAERRAEGEGAGGDIESVFDEDLPIILMFQNASQVYNWQVGAESAVGNDTAVFEVEGGVPVVGSLTGFPHANSHGVMNGSFSVPVPGLDGPVTGSWIAVNQTLADQETKDIFTNVANMVNEAGANGQSPALRKAIESIPEE